MNGCQEQLREDASPLLALQSFVVMRTRISGFEMLLFLDILV